jgi:hypothetical protein
MPNGAIATDHDSCLSSSHYPARKQSLCHLFCRRRLPFLLEDPWYSGLGATKAEREKQYQRWIDSQIAQGEWEQIRQATQRGRLIGQKTFQKQIEAMTGRRLVGEARGRPKKTATTVEKVL